jgi:hypothetical protein
VMRVWGSDACRGTDRTAQRIRRRLSKLGDRSPVGGVSKLRESPAQPGPRGFKASSTKTMRPTIGGSRDRRPRQSV